MSLNPTGTELTQEQRDALEALVDKCGLADVIEGLAVVCHEKAAHISETWQDRDTARPWTEAGRKLDKLAARTDV